MYAFNPWSPYADYKNLKFPLENDSLKTVFALICKDRYSIKGTLCIHPSPTAPMESIRFRGAYELEELLIKYEWNEDVVRKISLDSIGFFVR